MAKWHNFYKKAPKKKDIQKNVLEELKRRNENLQQNLENLKEESD